MVNLHFIRSRWSAVGGDYYAENTDVWVFADLEGYRYARQCLRRARSARTNVHLDQIDPRSNSMRVVIVPAARRPAKPRLKIIERIVFHEDRPEMELVLYGNAPGYDFLSAIFAKLARSARRDEHAAYDHEHVDESLPWIVKRSVFLNIRGPVRSWSKAALGTHAHNVFDRQPTYLPGDIEWLSPYLRPYEEIKPLPGSWLDLRS